MRIAVVTREYPSISASSGGIGSRYAVMVPELVRLGHEVHLVVWGNETVDDRHRDGLTLHVLADHGERPAITAVRWGLRVDRRLRRLGQFDVVVAPNWGGDAWCYARHKRCGPLITNVTASLAQLEITSSSEARGSIAQFVQKRLERSQITRSDALLSVSEYALDVARQLWNLNGIPAAALPNPVDTDRIRRLGREDPPAGFPATGPVIAFSGAIERQKGVDVLVEAMREVWNEFPAAHLVLAGRDDGEMLTTLRQIAGPFADRLHPLGFLNQDELFAVLAAADVVSCPSRWEASSNAALEAMALGCAVVFTNGSGFDECCEHGKEGLLVPPGDSSALAGALRNLLADRLRRHELGAAAAARISKEYAAPVATKRYAEYFETVAARSRAG